jgi:hypothetical protein
MFNSAPAVMIKVIDANNCETFIISPCGNIPTPTPTESPTPTPTITLTTTPTPTPTITLTTTPTPTPTITLTTTPTPTPTITLTTTPTPTPTLTPTTTLTPTLTLTPTPTPTPYVEYAYLIIEPYSARTRMNSWMLSQGSSWRGYNINAPSVIQPTFDSQFSSYINYSGWSIDAPAIRTAPISFVSGGSDAFGNPILAYTFQTHEVPSALLDSAEYAWYTWVVSTGATGGQKYSSISNSNSTSLTSRIMNSTYYNMTVNYTGSTIPTGTYRVYSTYGNNAFKIANLGLNLYFRGGNLVP